MISKSRKADSLDAPEGSATNPRRVDIKDGEHVYISMATGAHAAEVNVFAVDHLTVTTSTIDLLMWNIVVKSKANEFKVEVPE